jgi:hypothetical protein
MFSDREYSDMEGSDFLDLALLSKEDRKYILDLYKRFISNGKRSK